MASGKRSAKSSKRAAANRFSICDRQFVTVANRYARDVVSGKILACKWVTKACQRHLSDLEKSRRPEYEYKFSAKHAGRACRFIELLPHVKGEWARTEVGYTGLIKLEPWQVFITCSIFGWVDKKTEFRRFAEAYIKVARKNAKTTWAAGCGLFMLVADHEHGPEVYAGATTKKQAMEVFRTARRMAKKAPRFREHFDLEVNIESIVSRRDDGKFEPLVGDPGDGANPSCALVDEYHEHASSDLHDTMVTGMGSRRQGLTIVITTAGTNTAGPCYITEKDCEKLLDGFIENDSLFCVMYSADEGDDWKSIEAQKKANPNYGVSVFPAYLAKQLRDAMQSPHKQFIYKTKHLDLWGNTLNGYFNMDAWAHCLDASLTLDEFKGQACWMGNDLAAQIDLASRIKIFQEMLKNDQGILVRHYYVFGVHYAPMDTIIDGNHPHYQRWHEDGHLQAVPGPEIQLPVIQADIERDVGEYDFQRIAFDPWSALHMQQNLATQFGDRKKDENNITISVPQTVQYLSPAMKELDAAMRAGRIHHNGDPVLAWALSCVVARVDANDNVFPRKLENGKDKIDPATALITGLNQAMAGEVRRRYTKPIIGYL
jgi:phage terminase large subunit-like protein